MYVLRLYGLEGCPSCQQASQFIQSKQVPCEYILANGDPIIIAGNKAMNNGEDKYPLLLCNLPNEQGQKDMIVGFKQEEYERITKAVSAFFGGSAFNISRSEQQSNGENPAPSSEAVAGAK